jgi:hypothetical protein
MLNKEVTMTRTVQLDMDFTDKNVDYWLKGEVTLEIDDLTLNEVEVSELWKYRENDNALEYQVELESLNENTRNTLYNKMAEVAIIMLGEEGI